MYYLRNVWIYQQGNHNSSIDEQTKQWPKEEKGQYTNNYLENTTQRNTKIATRIALTTRVEIRNSGRDAIILRSGSGGGQHSLHKNGFKNLEIPS